MSCWWNWVYVWSYATVANSLVAFFFNFGNIRSIRLAVIQTISSHQPFWCTVICDHSCFSIGSGTFFAIHLLGEWLTVLSHVFATLLAWRQCCRSRYPLPDSMPVRLKLRTLCTDTFICLSLRWICFPHNWATVYNLFGEFMRPCGVLSLPRWSIVLLFS